MVCVLQSKLPRSTAVFSFIASRFSFHKTFLILALFISVYHNSRCISHIYLFKLCWARLGLRPTLGPGRPVLEPGKGPADPPGGPGLAVPPAGGRIAPEAAVPSRQGSPPEGRI